MANITLKPERGHLAFYVFSSFAGRARLALRYE
jgi:hypothetical protein